ncbi:MAG: SBBP repeat-containing protein, partial [Verrucomicrobia subdivision 3 bacterium]|nr:SBBP repeat-containing protein [Limisphaerales bacterium]
TGMARAGPTNLSGIGGNDIAVVKYDNKGQVLWATRAGGTTNDQGRAMVLDGAGDIYLTGHFRGTGFFGTTNVQSSGLDDVFVAKLDNAGHWQWVARAGGTNTDEGRGIGRDNAGNVYVAGTFTGNSVFGGHNLTNHGQWDIFLAKLSATGEWAWGRSIGGAGLDETRGMAVDALGNCYVTGAFAGVADFGETNLTSRGGADIFLAKFNADGRATWVWQAGGTNGDSGNAVTLDRFGNMYLTGGFAGMATFGRSNIIGGSIAGAQDMFVARLSAAGELLWVQRAGGSSQDAGNAIAVDREGNSYVSGLFVGSAFFGPFALASTSGQADVFFVKYTSTGSLQWAFQSRGTAYMSGNGTAVDDAGSVYGTGFFRSSTTFGGLGLTNSSFGRDAFIVRVDGPPRLRIDQSADGFVVSWPSWAVGYQLQSATNVGGSVWSGMTNLPQSTGDRTSIADGNSGERRFYRLRKQ